MEASEAIKDLEERGYLITPEALKIILESENPEELADIALENIGNRLAIEPADFEVKAKTKIAEEEKEEVVIEGTAFKPISKEYESRVNIVGNDVSENMSSKGTLDDFVNYFRSRYEKISGMLKTRGHEGLINIEKIKERRGERARLIGIIGDKRNTKNGHVFMTLEDMTGTVNALIPASNKRAIEQGNKLISDEIIAVDGRLSSKDLFIIDQVYQPDIPRRDQKTISEDLGIAMLSDLHIGSKLFLEDNFENFLEWLKGNRGDEKLKGIASKIKYITIAGDLVDGIGIYPKQEYSLEITDIFEQYKVFSDYVSRIPEHIHIIISPGNHDAVKNSDPQPRIPPELVPDLYKMKNVTFIGSPSMVSLHGLNVLMYHGTCVADFVNSVPGARFDQGAKIMVEMLKKRHVHPMYGGKPITPEPEDHLVIQKLPDIFQMGETHSNSYERYNGIICVNSGTWQQITEYQIKQGHKATPAILPVVEMKTGKIRAVHFDKPF